MRQWAVDLSGKRVGQVSSFYSYLDADWTVDLFSKKGECVFCFMSAQLLG